MHFKTKGHIRQFFVAITVCILNISYGFSLSWVAPVQDLLKSKNSPVGPLSDSQISWLGSLPSLGAIVGSFIWADIINRLGRKKSALLATTLFFIVNISLAFSKMYYLLVILRFLNGISIVGAMVNNSNYIFEISGEKYKGNLGSLVLFFVTLGTVLTMVISNLFNNDYFHINLTMAVFSFVEFFLLLLIPESPVFLLKMGENKKAEEVLKWLQATNNQDVIDAEMNTLKQTFVNTTETKRKLTLHKIFSNAYYKKVLIIGLILQSSIALTGISMVLVYTHDILHRILHSDHNGNIAVLLTFSQNIGAMITIFVCQLWNRKVFFITSQSIGALCMLLLSAILILGESILHIQVSAYLIIPILCCFMFVQGFGTSTVIYIILPELFSAECRNTFMSALMFLHFILNYCVAKLYPVLVDHIQVYGWTLIFGFYSSFISIFCFFFLPETKNRSVQYIFSKLCKTDQIKGENMNTETTRF